MISFKPAEKKFEMQRMFDNTAVKSSKHFQQQEKVR